MQKLLLFVNYDKLNGVDSINCNLSISAIIKIHEQQIRVPCVLHISNIYTV